MTTLFINGKFLAQRTTGVQRVAQQLLRALDARLTSAPHAGPVVLLLPPGATAPALRHVESATVGLARVPLHFWEQCLLPWASRSGMLLSLAGSAPLLANRQVCLLHDAAVFDTPQAYSAAFGLWYRTLFRLLPRRHATLLTVSAFSRARLAANLGIPVANIGLAPNGGEHLQDVEPDVGVLKRLGIDRGSYYLAVGSISPNKNFEALQSAFALLGAGSGVKLVMVGAEDRRVFANRAARGAPAGAGIVHAGALDDAALKALYQHAIALVFPSLYEGFGLPPLEAMSCGCPVAASSAAAIPEICGDAALYFDPNSVEEIAAAMQQLADDDALRDRLRLAGAKRVQHFHWGRAAALLYEHVEAARLAGKVPP